MRLMALLACLSCAAEKRPLEFRDIVEMAEPSQPRISPDGTRVAFVLTRSSVEKNSTQRTLWLASRDGRPRLLLDPAPGPVEWAPDGRSLIVRSGKAFRRVSLDGSTATIFEHDNPILSAWWAADKSQALFTSAATAKQDLGEGVLYDETVHGIRSFTRGDWLPPRRAALWHWKTGMTAARPVGADVPRITSAAWSPDGSAVALEYAAATQDNAIGVLRLAPDRFDPLVATKTYNRSVQWLPGRRSLVFSRTGEDGKTYVPRTTITIVEVSSRREAAISGNGPWFYSTRIEVEPSGDILAEYDDWSSSTLYRVPASGGPATPVYKGRDHLSSFHFTPDRRFAACVRQSFTTPPEIAVLDLETGLLETLTDLNPAFKNIPLQPAVERRWRNRYGHESIGRLVLPPGFKKGTPVPLVMIHYGLSNRFTAQAQWMTSYPVQHLAAAGIAVLLHNHPHELGWKPGDFEAAAMSQAYSPLASMEAAIESLVREGIADSANIGIAGWSFGSYLAELAITQTRLFRAASAGEGGLNNAGQYWVTGSRAMQEYLDSLYGGPPFGAAYANYAKIAPGMNAHRVTVPLLREYGTDTGVQSLEFYMALRRLGKPVEQYIYPGAPHVFDSPAYRIASMRRNLDWFRYWLQDYEDPEPVKQEQYRRWRLMRERR